MPKIVDHEAYRRELLIKSFQLFAAHGYGALTMRALANGLSVSTGTLYHYFTGKEDLFLQLVAVLKEQDFQLTSEIMARDGTTTEKIAAMFAVIGKHADYYYKRLLVLCGYLQHEQSQGRHGLEATAQDYRKEMTRQLGIKQEKVLNLVCASLHGLLFMYGVEHITIDFEAQGRLLGHMIERHNR